MHRDLTSDMERRRAQALTGWDKEARTLRCFGLRDGMAILEPGSGAGFITAQLLALLPHATVTGVENDPQMIRRAEQTLVGPIRHRCSLVAASVLDTGLPADTFDFAIARLLFQHLPDPVGVAREFFRVLKPGGKLAIIDVDQDLFWLWDPPVPEADRLMERVRQLQAARGGNGSIGRRLWRILEAAGFDQLDLEAVAVHSHAEGLDPVLVQSDPDLVVAPLDGAAITTRELAMARAGRERFLDAPDPFLLLLRFVACGTKPLRSTI